MDSSHISVVCYAASEIFFHFGCLWHQDEKDSIKTGGFGKLKPEEIFVPSGFKDNFGQLSLKLNLVCDFEHHIKEDVGPSLFPYFHFTVWGTKT